MASMALGSARTPREESLSSDRHFCCGDLRFAMNGAAVFERGTRCTFERVEGKMRPRMASTLLLTRIASVKSPVTCVSAARKKITEIVANEAAAGVKRY